jgi:hypothetical protein
MSSRLTVTANTIISSVPIIVSVTPMRRPLTISGSAGVPVPA